MSSTRRGSVADAQAESFDTLARTFTRRFHRRRVFGLLAATMATGVLGAAVHTPEAAARKKGGHGGRGGEHCGKYHKCAGPTPPQPQPAACLAEGDQCGTTAGVPGQCRRAALTDNQAGFICTSLRADATCSASTQCPAGSRCTVGVVPAGQVPALNCRVVIA
jgi:hypothetical protein